MFTVNLFYVLMGLVLVFYREILADYEELMLNRTRAWRSIVPNLIS